MSLSYLSEKIPNNGILLVKIFTFDKSREFVAQRSFDEDLNPISHCAIEI